MRAGDDGDSLQTLNIDNCSLVLTDVPRRAIHRLQLLLLLLLMVPTAPRILH